MTTSSSSTTSPGPEQTRRPARRLATISVGVGVLLSVIWSYQLVDTVIGDGVSNTILGQDAKQLTIGTAVSGVVFAFVSGFAGTFTACNVAVFAALPQVAGSAGTEPAGPGRARTVVLRSLGWLAVGMLIVSGTYGVVSVLVGDRLLQLSTHVTSSGMPDRLIQSMIAFGVIGVVFVYLGLGSLGVVSDPLQRHRRLRLLVLGAAIGGFLVGRPFALFQKLLAYAVRTDNPAFGALVMMLQSLGNIVVVTVLAALVVGLARLVPAGWMTTHRLTTLSGVMLVALGTFLVVYWDLRLPSMFGIGWFPRMPWS